MGIEGNSASINDIFDMWCNLKRGIKDNTFQGYKHSYNLYVRPWFGRMLIKKVKKSDVKRFYNSLADTKNLSPYTIDSVHTVLHQVFDLAVDDNYIRNNPSSNVLRELKQSHVFKYEKRRGLTKDEQELFLNFMKNSNKYRHWYPIFAVMIGTGLRVGEARLIEKYPFLKVKCFTGKRERTDDSSTMLDFIPAGWKKAFGEQMCADIKDAIMEDDPSGEKWKTYYVIEAKEKYGELRWYDTFNGKKKDDVMWIYTHISQHTCVRCGRINVPVFDDGWVSPYCPACFKEYRKSYTGDREETDADIRRFIVEDTDMTRNVRIRSYDSERYSVRSIDCSDTLRRIGFDPAVLSYAENEPDGCSIEGEE